MSYRNTLFIGFALVFSSLLLQCHEIQGKEWLVGDQKGWSPGINNWPNGKNFTPGDVLVFKYDNKTATKVWVVDSPSAAQAKMCYDECDYYICGYTEYKSGNDRLVLKEGVNYFRSNDYTACMKDFKIKVCAWYDGKRKNCA